MHFSHLRKPSALLNTGLAGAALFGMAAASAFAITAAPPAGINGFSPVSMTLARYQWL